jgi:branched-chain amino acid transport system ATP-binding protein
MSAPALLEVDGLTKNFGGLQVLSGVCLMVREGEIAGLIGPNGAGKTTLFNVINGITVPDGGQIRFAGRTLTGADPYAVCQAGIARTFQTGRAFLTMSALENVLVGARFGPAGRGAAARDAEERAREVLRFLELEGKPDVPVAQLHPMERKLVELGRALATGPRMILMDEPLAGLNQAELPRVAEIIRRLRQAYSVTIFWVEHIMTTLMGTCDRVVVLHQGVTLAEGRPEEIIQDPRVKEAYLGSKSLRIPQDPA